MDADSLLLIPSVFTEGVQAYEISTMILIHVNKEICIFLLVYIYIDFRKLTIIISETFTFEYFKIKYCVQEKTPL